LLLLQSGLNRVQRCRSADARRGAGEARTNEFGEGKVRAWDTKLSLKEGGGFDPYSEGVMDRRTEAIHG